MKKLKLNDTDKNAILEEFKKRLEEYDPSEDDDLCFNKILTTKAKDKIHIYFTPQAYLMCETLVKTFTGEVGWNGLIKKYEDGYLVYDMMVYPQDVNGARTLDPTTNNDWMDKYDDVITEMRYQAHSHVSMSTTASGTDMENQRNWVQNLTRGIQLFQIWNKQGDINSFLYDIDEGLLYTKDDIEIEVLLENGTMNDFVNESKSMVKDLKVTPLKPDVTVVQTKDNITKGYTPAYSWGSYYDNKMKDPFYWRDENGHEGW